MGSENRAVGPLGEDIAARFLAGKGYRIIGRNVRTFVGELDIVARKYSSMIFVEVKTRKSKLFGPPYLSITAKKKRKLMQCALCYLKMKGITDSPWQIDIISINVDKFKNVAEKIEHFENAIEE